MVIILTAALVLMICGTTVLRPLLDPHERPGWFTFFWLVCAWLTLTAILLAAFDLLMVTSQARKARRELEDQLENDSSGSSNRR
jgi:drug/metabolite transporter (DMT)-like permease